MTSYQHTQPATVTRWALLPAAALPIGMFLLLPQGTGQGLGRFAAAVACIVLVLSVVAFWSLTIRIVDRRLEWSFGPGVLRKSVPVADIAEVTPTRTRWYEGWGIHLTRRGWLYNVAGFDAVWIRLKSGRQIMLGTDEPERLLEAIRSAPRA